MPRKRLSARTPTAGGADAAAPPPKKSKNAAEALTKAAALAAGPLSTAREALEAPHHTKAAVGVFQGPAAPPVATWRTAPPIEEEAVAVITSTRPPLAQHNQLRLAAMYGLAHAPATARRGQKWGAEATSLLAAGAAAPAAAAVDPHATPPSDDQVSELQRELLSDVGSRFARLIRGAPPSPPRPTAPLGIGTICLHLKPSYTGRSKDLSLTAQRNAVLDTCFGEFIRESSSERIAALGPAPTESSGSAAAAAAALSAPISSSGAGSAAAAALPDATSEPNGYGALHAAYMAEVREADRLHIQMAPMLEGHEYHTTHKESEFRVPLPRRLSPRLLTPTDAQRSNWPRRSSRRTTRRRANSLQR